MSGEDFKKLLAEHDVTVVDVAYKTKLCPTSVYKFLRGEKPARRTLAEFVKFAEQLKTRRREVALDTT